MKVLGSRFFGKYYLLTALIVIAFVAIGLITSRLLTRLSPSPVEDHHAVFYAKLLDTLSPHDRVAGIAKLRELKAAGPNVLIHLVDAGGKVIAPKDEALSYDWASMQKPEQPYEFESVRAPFRTIMRLPGEPPQYLSVASLRGGRPLVPSLLFSSTFAALSVSVILGIGLSLVVLFQSIREKAALADSIIAEIQSGNLKARFPINRFDEVGRAMGRFNRMADEIERLVERLKNTEQARMRLLQDLAHDLRTPLASLKNLLETLESGRGRLDAPTHDELLSLSTTEVGYLERLVEDLLVLAQVSEPRYHRGQDLVALSTLLVDEAESALGSRPATAPKIRLVRETKSSFSGEVKGNALLLRRMIRNILDNAFSFAKSEVRVAIHAEARAEGSPESIALVFEDDGPGFADSQLETYGERRSTRVLTRASEARGQERISIGLGSVIARAVAEAHGGRIEVANRQPATGARIVIHLPVS